NNEQREIIYSERRKVLDGESMRPSIVKMITEVVEGAVDTCIREDSLPEEWDINELNNLLLPIIPLEPVSLTEEQIKHYTKKELMQSLKEKALALYESKEAEFPQKEQFREVERVILLRAIDRKWMNHIDDMEQLKQGIGLQAYGQKNPVQEYKMQGYDMFDDMEAAIAEETVQVLMHIKVEQKVEREEVAKITGTNRDDTAVKGPVKRATKKIMPNDPCPCGSGKKYKFCCGR
ncbi:MAG: SEC-C domain-containing protein, partial [Lachnospiraceae bacterium]|nr:SEC-C domain-containing protein [Lachnospiraceae bacterium]